MQRFSFLLIFSLILTLSCKEETDPPLDPVTASLVSTLNEELEPLSQDPLAWTNDQLAFLDAYGSNTVVGLGEATHGTSEFFKAKQRMLRYLVENHGFKVFAIEADFGESLFINEAVLSGNRDKIVELMKGKMHFWTWQTTEVRDLIFWMCDYNVGKPEAQKVQYWGVDCQFNTFHPDMVKEQLAAANMPFRSFFETTLSEIKAATAIRFAGVYIETFDAYRQKLDALTDSLTKHHDEFTAAQSESKFQLTLRLVRLTKQVSEVAFYSQIGGQNYRDEYMAENTIWLNEHLSDSKIVLWAHNFHVSNDVFNDTMGYNLEEEFGEDYASIGFLFSKGTFRAVKQVDQQFHGLVVNTLEADPKEGSINEVMSHAEVPVFVVNLSHVAGHQEWNSAFGRGIEYFQMGAVYNNRPGDYYSPFKLLYFDDVIYFNNTSTAAGLP